MKVIHEIIDFLFSESVINNEDIILLQTMGYYPKYVSINDDEYGHHESSHKYDEFHDEDAPYDEELEMENKLNDNRKRKLGKSGKFRGAKRRSRAKVKTNTFMRKLEDSNMFWNPPQIILINETLISNLSSKFNVPFAKKLYALQDRQYEDLSLFWLEIKQLVGWELILQFCEPFLAAIMEIHHKVRAELYIKPTAYFELKKEKNIYFCRYEEELELYLVLDHENIIRITKSQGILDICKMPKDETKYIVYSETYLPE